VVVCLLSASLASVAFGVFFPEVVDDDASVVPDLIGVGIWALSAVLGVSEASRYLRQSASSRPKDRADLQ